VPALISEVSLAKVIGLLYVPVPPAHWWMSGYAMAQPGGVLSYQP
jgi:hypothetical protein